MPAMSSSATIPTEATLLNFARQLLTIESASRADVIPAAVRDADGVIALHAMAPVILHASAGAAAEWWALQPPSMAAPSTTPAAMGVSLGMLQIACDCLSAVAIAEDQPMVVQAVRGLASSVLHQAAALASETWISRVMPGRARLSVWLADVMLIAVAASVAAALIQSPPEHAVHKVVAVTAVQAAWQTCPSELLEEHAHAQGSESPDPSAVQRVCQLLLSTAGITEPSAWVTKVPQGGYVPDILAIKRWHWGASGRTWTIAGCLAHHQLVWDEIPHTVTHRPPWQELLACAEPASDDEPCTCLLLSRQQILRALARRHELDDAWPHPQRTQEQGAVAVPLCDLLRDAGQPAIIASQLLYDAQQGGAESDADESE